MKSVFWKWTAVLVVGTFAAWFGIKFALPVALPFLFGTLLALAAEPVVSFGVRRLRLPRSAAAGVGVGLSLVLLFGLLVLVFGLLMRQLSGLAENLPDMAQTMSKTENVLLSAAKKAPPKLRNLAENTVRQTFDDSSALMTGMAGKLPELISSVFGYLGSSLMAVGTGVLAAFLISARLPRLRKMVKERLPQNWQETYLPAAKRAGHCLWAWVKAQGKLALVTCLLLAVGFWLMGVPKFLLWAGLIALVDAVPVLGTGTILLPWAGVCLLQGQSLRAMALVSLWGVAVILRTVLEPRVLGKQLGLDPLWTLVAMYAGFRFFGIPGLLFTPIAASAIKSMTR